MMKEKKVSDVEMNFLFDGLYQEIDDVVKDCLWSFRASHTDYETLFLKLKLNDKTGKNCQNLEEIIKMHERKPH